MILSRLNVYSSLVAFYFFLLSYFFIPFAITGDQSHYIPAYYADYSFSFFDDFSLYNTFIYSYEPVHFVIILLSSSLGFDKDFIMTISNVILSILFFRYLIKSNYPAFLSFIITHSSYMFALFFTIERHKFAIIFFLIFLLYRSRFFLITSFFTHVTMALPFFSYYLSDVFINSRSFVHFLKRSLFLLLFCSVLIFALFDHIALKLIQALDDVVVFDNFDFVKSLFLFIFSYPFVRDKNHFILFALFFLPAVLFLGGIRLNMLAYFSVLFFIDTNKSSSLVFISLVSTYFFLKSFLYLYQILTIGV